METSDKIAEKASELFLKYGIRSFIMDEIAVRLGMAKKTIYKFFENKSALVERFVIRETTSNRDSCKMLSTANYDPLIRLFFTMIYAKNFYLKVSQPALKILEKYYYESYLIFRKHKEEFLFNAIKIQFKKG